MTPFFLDYKFPLYVCKKEKSGRIYNCWFSLGEELGRDDSEIMSSLLPSPPCPTPLFDRIYYHKNKSLISIGEGSNRSYFLLQEKNASN